MKNISYASREWSGEPAYLHSLARAFADCTKMKAQANFFLYQFIWFSYLSHMRAGKDKASMHIRTVSSEPSLIALERRDIDEDSGQIVYTIYVIKVLFAYSSSEWLGEPAHSHSLTRAFGNHTQKKGCSWRLRPNCIGQFKSVWY